MAMSWFLVPVSRHSIIISVLGWNPIHATQIHICSGYLALFGGIVHGLYWIVNWYRLDKKSFFENIVPPIRCWDKDIIFGQAESSTCYDTFMNSTGALPAVFFIILGMTSLWWVRRKLYKLFYTCHIIFAALLCLALVLHYNRMIIYICPSVLYYAASTGPFLIESVMSYIQGGTDIVKVKHIPQSGNCVEVSFHLSPESYPDCRTAMETISTQYVRICVPELSFLWHPFTVYFTTHDEDIRLNLMFRCYGKFTNALAARLKSQARPKILVDGFYSGASSYPGIAS